MLRPSLGPLLRKLLATSLALITLAALSAYPSHVAADTGPKPSQEYVFDFATAHVDIVDGLLLECHDSRCTDAQPLRAEGPQRFFCSKTACSSRAYGYAPYHKLAIRFADRTRESNVFQQRAFDARFRVAVLADRLVVSEVQTAIRSPLQILFFIPAAVLTLGIESLIAALYFRRHTIKRALRWVVVANLISLPIVWFVFPLLPLSNGAVLALAELFAFTFEAWFIYRMRRDSLSLRQAVLLSILMNTPSLVIGALFI